MDITTPARPLNNTLHYFHYSLPTHSIILLVLWSILTLLVSLAGNTVILIGTIRHNAIKLDKISLILIKNLAVADLFSAVLIVLPSTWSLAKRRALFNDNLIVCSMSSYIQLLFPIISSIIVSALAVNKLMVLLKPLKTLERSGINAHVICLLAWVCGLVPAVEFLIVGGKTPVFDTRSCRCMMSWQGSPLKDTWIMLDNLTTIFFVLLPFFVIIISTLWLYFFLRRVRVIQKQSIMLILSVGITYLISFIPYLLYVILANALKLTSAQKYRSNVVGQLYAGALYVNYLNTMSNPILYYFTSASFNRYVRRYASYWWGRVNGTQTGPMRNLDLSVTRDNIERKSRESSRG